MSGRLLYVTGTDTGVGKTEVALALIAALQKKSLRVAAYKPCETGGGDDADRLARATGQALPTIRYRLAVPAAPQVAAAVEGVRLEPRLLMDDIERLRADADWLILEGAGGLLVPLAEDRSLSDLLAPLAPQTLIVARPGLGTINHTALTIEAARRRALPLLGFVFSRPGPPAGPDEPMNALTIRRMTGVPYLGSLRRDPEELSAVLDTLALH